MSILIILLVVSLLVYIVSDLIFSARTSIKNELREIYNLLELEFVKNERKMDNKAIKFLSNYKFASELTELMDIQVLWSLHEMLDKSNLHASIKEIKDFKEKLTEKEKSYIDEFDKKVEQLVQFSYLKPDFLFWLIKTLLSLLFKSIYRHSTYPFVKANNYYKELKDEVKEIILCGNNNYGYA